MPKRDYSKPPSPFLMRAADRLYDECERVVREGRIDARSPIGDATLDYRDMRWPASEADHASEPTNLRCKVCGAVLSAGQRHKHEAPGWKPRYDDLEGALEGYETEAIPDAE